MNDHRQGKKKVRSDMRGVNLGSHVGSPRRVRSPALGKPNALREAFLVKTEAFNDSA